MTLRRLTRVAHLVLAISATALFSLWAQEQETDAAAKQQEEYRKQYGVVQDCAGVTDPEERQKCALNYLEEAGDKFPDLSKWAQGEYFRAMTEQVQKNEHEKIVVAGEAILKYRPDDIILITQLCYSAYHSRQYSKAAGYCETVYAKNPEDKNFFKILINAYKESGDKANYREMSKKAVDLLEPAQGFVYLEGLLAEAAEKDNSLQAGRYARKMLELLSSMERTSEVSEREWNGWLAKKRAFCYLLLGRNAYEGQDWARTVVHYQRVLRNSRDGNLRGEAHYYIGMSNWKESRLQPAMEAFACGAAQRGSPHARPSDNYLIKLYESTHNGSTAGLEEFKARVNGTCS